MIIAFHRGQASANEDGPRDTVTLNRPSRCTQTWTLSVIDK